jgi:hypothetical protein
MSWAHVARVVALAQALFVEVHTGSFLQEHAAMPGGPAQLWCAPQGELTELKKQPCPSCAHVVTVLEFAQTPPVLEQVGSVLHVQLAAPAAPAQLWWAPVQAAGVP